ncbi:MAG: glycosyltransferase family 39 protein [Patescibacteria group bacterium]|mgnify:CR=1 FL=1
MERKIFWFCFFGILIFGLVLRVVPTLGNNFYFTIDQGDDAIHAREFFTRGKLLTKGPETGIQGVHAGPLWYYFISLGYLIFDKDPFGAVFMMIVLNLAVTAVLMWQIKKHVGWRQALAVGCALTFQWAFYDTSRYGFNPFPLVACGFALVLLLSAFLRGSAKYYMYAAVPVGLAFNAEVAGAAAMGVFYVLFGAWAWIKKKLALKTYILSAFLLPGVFVLKMIWDAYRVWQATHTLPESNLNTFGGINFLGVGKAFLEVVGEASIPQNTLFGVGLWVVICGIGIRHVGKFPKHFIMLSLGLYFVSFVFLGASRGWQDWHDLFLPPLLFVTLILVLCELWQRTNRYGRIGVIGVIGVILISQASMFKDRYLQYLHPSDDPGLLVNQIKVVDWIYQNAENNGFNVYTYTPNKYDDHYQYVFWWHGRNNYKYLPCEYSFMPKAIKYLYVPNSELPVYTEPKLGCDKFVFLIMEPFNSFGSTQDKFAQGKPDPDEWFEKAKTNTELLEEKMIGKVRVQKRKYPDKISS